MPFFSSSFSQSALIRKLPLPVLYASIIFSLFSTSHPPVGKSGPGIYSCSFSKDALGCFIKCNNASHISQMLWGGIDVAIPTAIPWAPLASKFGNAAGRTRGSLPSPSYVSRKSTVSSSIPSSNRSATVVILASVYRMAAALSPSILPKFP